VKSCITCQHGGLRDRADLDRDEILQRMVRLGFVNCQRSHLRASFHPLGYCCEKHTDAASDAMQARMQWMQKQQARKAAAPEP
jgi:hypothetical protein